jgi:hypothetical protein
VDTVIRLIPQIGPTLLGILRVPCWNYLDILRNGLRTKPIRHAIYEWYQWAVMDTFDALGAKYDYPKTIDEVRKMVCLEGAAEIEVFYASNGIVANTLKRR